MAAARVTPAPAATSANARRARRVFSIRLTAEQRDELERAAARKFGPVGRPLGRFVRYALSLALDDVLGRRR